MIWSFLCDGDVKVVSQSGIETQDLSRSRAAVSTHRRRSLPTTHERTAEKRREGKRRKERREDRYEAEQGRSHRGYENIPRIYDDCAEIEDSLGGGRWIDEDDKV